MTCPCGCEVSKRHLKEHEKSIKHRLFINPDENIIKPESIICICGVTVQKISLLKHEKSQYHQNFIKEKQ